MWVSEFASGLVRTLPSICLPAPLSTLLSSFGPPRLQRNLPESSQRGWSDPSKGTNRCSDPKQGLEGGGGGLSWRVRTLDLSRSPFPATRGVSDRVDSGQGRENCGGPEGCKPAAIQWQGVPSATFRKAGSAKALRDRGRGRDGASLSPGLGRLSCGLRSQPATLRGREPLDRAAPRGPCAASGHAPSPRAPGHGHEHPPRRRPHTHLPARASAAPETTRDRRSPRPGGGGARPARRLLAAGRDAAGSEARWDPCLRRRTGPSSAPGPGARARSGRRPLQTPARPSEWGERRLPRGGGGLGIPARSCASRAGPVRGFACPADWAPAAQPGSARDPARTSPQAFGPHPFPAGGGS